MRHNPRDEMSLPDDQLNSMLGDAGASITASFLTVAISRRTAAATWPN